MFKQRTFALLFIFIMILTMLPATALAVANSDTDRIALTPKISLNKYPGTTINKTTDIPIEFIKDTAPASPSERTDELPAAHQS